MKILALGATGYVGSAVARRLVAEGHVVVRLVRPDSAGTPDMADEVRYGDLEDPESLTGAVTSDIDAVVHVAAPTGVASTDLAATAALLAPLRGTGRPFVYTSGTWVLGPTGDRTADEDSAVAPIEIVRGRPDVEQQVLASASTGVRSLVIRPGVVHGRGGGIPALLVDLAQQQGGGVYVGNAHGRWPMVHVDDLADLFLAALQGAPAGTLLHGVSEPAVPVAALAAAAARVAGVATSVRSWPVDEAAAVLGAPFAEALALDQSVSGDRARRVLNWRPRQAGGVADLVAGSYTGLQASA